MDPFPVLGLRQGECTEQDVKKAYRNLALKHHPDKAGPSGLAKMKELNCAHDEILSKQLWWQKPRPAKDVLREPSSSSTPQAPPSPGTEDGPNVFLRAYKVPGTPAPASSTPYKPYSRPAASSSSSANYKTKSQPTPDNPTTPSQLQNFAEYTILLANFIESKLPNPIPGPLQLNEVLNGQAPSTKNSNPLPPKSHLNSTTSNNSNGPALPNTSLRKKQQSPPPLFNT